jgi:hypothetical protein
VFRAVLQAAKEEVLLGSSKATAFDHKGIRGDERAASLAQFLRQRLPERFGVGKGEVLDYLDHRTGQLDLVVYDKSSSAPISAQNENLLLPCEALYIAIEVKSIVTQAELDKALKAAARLRELRPFKAHFVAPRKDGSPADDENHRCMYVVFGYTSDLANDSDWLPKEQTRINSAARAAGVCLDCVDRLIILDRGIINPAASAGKWDAGSDASIFLENYLHLVNFLGRESRRRPPVDWQVYGPRSAKGWKSIKGAG